MSFRLLFVANDFALREQGVSRVNNAGGAADQAACVEKRNSARKSADIRCTSPAAAEGDTFGGANIASRQRQQSTATVAAARLHRAARVESAQTRKARSLSERFRNDWIRRADLTGRAIK